MLLSRQGASLIVWMIVFTIVITTVVFFRFQAARIKKRALRPDDYMIVIAYISTLALEAGTWWAIANGLGAHTSELSKYEVGVQYKVLLSSGITWLSATAFCKLSILQFYTCIFTTRPFKIAARILMLIVSGYGISFVCVFLTNCRPISQSWNPIPGGYCKSVTVEELTSVSVNMFIDTCIVILPMPPLWGLQMPIRKKFAISVLFALGLLVVAVMGWRIQITVQSITETDFVYGLGDIGLVTHLEVWIGITVACLPTLTPLFSKYLGPVTSRILGRAGKPAGQRQLKEAKHSIGSGEPRGFSKKYFNRLDKDSLIELEDGQNFSSAEATVRSTFTNEEDEQGLNNPNAISVQHNVQVYREPQKH